MKKLTLSISGLSLILLASCGQTETKTTTLASKDTAIMVKDEQASTATRVVTNWDSVDFATPIVKYNEITSKDVEVRGNEKYSIYGMSDEVLFSTGKADLREESKVYLSQVASAMKAHNNNADVRVYGYADSKGDAAMNKELSEKRATVVKNYLADNAGIPSASIEVVAKGETEPAASNSTAAGRQQNRRVRVVAMNK